MPGLAGFASCDPLLREQVEHRLAGLAGALTVSRRHSLERLVCDAHVGGALARPSWRAARQIARAETGEVAWFDGALCGVPSAASRLLEILTGPAPGPLLGTLEGLFSAAVYDARRGLLHLVSDRYGLRPLYWHCAGRQVAWASEVKAFLALPDFSPAVDETAREGFFATGQLPPERTWLDGVATVPPATLLTFRLDDGTVSGVRYWQWPDLAPPVGRPALAELAEELGRLLRAAVARRLGDGAPGLALSGGLDSRAILAAMPGAAPTFTFGDVGSSDVAIAARAAARKGSPHTVLPIDGDGWLAPRIAGLWWTDGLLNVMHMHGGEHLEALADAMHVCLNGAGGDGLVGGGHLFAADELSGYLRDRLHLRLEEHPDLRLALEAAFARAGSAHAFYVEWRMRGFTVHGPRMGLFQGLEYALPFLDNAVQEFLCDVPLACKRGNRLYRAALLSTFPDDFGTLPWQRTGRPLSWPAWAVTAARALDALRGRPRPRPFVDYAAWLRRPPARSVFESVLLSGHALWRNHRSAADVSDLWQRHLAGADHAELLCRYLTFELYLQQVFHRRYRTAEELDGLRGPGDAADPG